MRVEQQQRQVCIDIAAKGAATWWSGGLRVALFCLCASVIAGPVDEALAATGKRPKAATPKATAEATAVQRYVEAVAGGDAKAAWQLDFACQYRAWTSGTKAEQAVPTCWQQIEAEHANAVERRDQGMNAIWPGKDRLVFFTEDLSHYPPSTLVMPLLGTSPPGSGIKSEVLTTSALPAASFPARSGEKVVAARATKVTLRITYKDALTSPIAYAPGAYQWTSTVERPRRAIKAVAASWVAISGLKKLGFPQDIAVLNLPVSAPDDPQGAIPFVTETGGADSSTTQWWGPEDVPGLMTASVGRAALLPELHHRVAMLNRIIMIDPMQPDALTVLTRDLYDALLAAGTQAHHVSLSDPGLRFRFNELFWDTYAQTTRMDIAIGMDMGESKTPTAADFLYRLVPAMEKLAKVRPEDVENRIRLGIIYRWNNDQLIAIHTHEALAKELEDTRKASLRARALIQLAWSRIAKVAWNRILDDPGVREAINEANEAFQVSDQPLDKFIAAYTSAYAMLFLPARDNQAVLDRLTEAREWYLKVPGAGIESWRFLLSNDNVKGLVEADPAFQPLLAAAPQDESQAGHPAPAHAP